METNSRFLNSVDLIIEDSASAIKVAFFPVIILTTLLSVIAISGFFSLLLLDSRSAGNVFYGIMNLNNIGVNEPLRIILSTLNWVSLGALIIFFSFSVVQYIKEVNERAAWRKKIANSRKISYFPENGSSNNFKQAGNH